MEDTIRVNDDIENLVRYYEPSEDAVALMQVSRIALLAGISGAGKDTIKRSLMAHNPIFHDIVSHTTRPPRQNNNKLESDGVDYHFIDMEQAKGMLERHEFIEAKFVHGTIYGTSVAEIQKAHDNQHIAITDVDIQGVAEIKKLAPSAISIFIVPPSYDTWLERLKARYFSQEEFEREWPKRRASSIIELTKALETPYYHFIINDDIDRATRVAEEIILRDDVFYEKDNQARILTSELLKRITE